MGDMQCACSCLLLCILSLFWSHQGKFSDDDDDDDDKNRGDDNDNFGGDYDNCNDFGAYSPGAVSTCAYIHTHDNNLICAHDIQ